MGRTHGREPIGQSMVLLCQRNVWRLWTTLIDVFDTSLQEAITSTKRRRANDSDLSSDDEELGDRIWELMSC